MKDLNLRYRHLLGAGELFDVVLVIREPERDLILRVAWWMEGVVDRTSYSVKRGEGTIEEGLPDTSELVGFRGETFESHSSCLEGELLDPLSFDIVGLSRERNIEEALGRRSQIYEV